MVPDPLDMEEFGSPSAFRASERRRVFAPHNQKKVHFTNENTTP